MDKELFKYYKIIGKIQSLIARSETLDDALQNGLKLILESCKADYCLIWYLNDKDNALHPYYWICPSDFTQYKYQSGEGTVGGVFKSSKTVRKLDYKKEPDEKVSQMYREIDISS